MNQKYSNEETIEYFDDPTTYYQNEMKKNESKLNQHIDNQKVTLADEIKHILNKSRKQVVLLY